MLNYKKLERLIKSFANHRRIQILELLEKEPKLSVDEVAEKLNTNFQTTSDHIRKLYTAGLVEKDSDLRYVRHTLTKLGKVILSFCKMTI